MQVFGPTQVHGPHAINSPHATQGTKSPELARPSSAGDEVQISAAAQLIDKLSEVPEIRAGRVAELRAQIAAGTYESADKVDGAIERLLDEIG